ncbi:hypothetical protein OIV83_005361 [Microbotryomycetes sp. JL201]|nr:hypothetical protein OIV83_005361 [Microbotryomycetes sp. JL201]
MALSVSAQTQQPKPADHNDDMHIVKNIEVAGMALQVTKVIGKGCSGTVYLCKYDQAQLALKVIRKKRVLAQGDVRHTMTEQCILKNCHSPFVVNLLFSAQDKTKLYLGLDFHIGGDLAGQLATEGRLHRDRARFIMCELVVAISSLHELPCVWRDCKPENILLSMDGHIVLTDFGLSKIVPKTTAVVRETDDLDLDMAATFCGTAEYLAPEILLGNPYGIHVDAWAMGTVLYEMLAGEVPFAAEDHAQMYSKILNNNVTFDDSIFDEAVQSLIRGLLHRDPNLRLLPDEQRLRSHPYFAGIDWTTVAARGYAAPFVPLFKKDASHERPEEMPDLRYFDETFLQMEPSICSTSNCSDMSESVRRRSEMGHRGVSESISADNLFDGYDFIRSSFAAKRSGAAAPLKKQYSYNMLARPVSDSNLTAAVQADRTTPTLSPGSTESELFDCEVVRNTAEYILAETKDQHKVVKVATKRGAQQSEQSDWSCMKSTSIMSLPGTLMSSVDVDWQLLPHATTTEGHVMPSARNGSLFFSGKAKILRPSRSLFGLSSFRIREQAQKSAEQPMFPLARTLSRSWKLVVRRRRRGQELC